MTYGDKQDIKYQQVDNSDYRKRAYDSVYWCHVTMADDLTGMQQLQSVCGPTAHAPTHPCRFSGIIMVHAVLTPAVKE